MWRYEQIRRVLSWIVTVTVTARHELCCRLPLTLYLPVVDCCCGFLFLISMSCFITSTVNSIALDVGFGLGLVDMVDSGGTARVERIELLYGAVQNN
jgi:hypothetical protein